MRIVILTLSLCTSLLAFTQPYRITSIGNHEGLSSSYVTSIARDKHGSTWIATEEGLNCLHGALMHTFFKNRGPQPTLTGNEINCLLDDPKDNLMWIGTQRNGLCAYNYDTFTFSTFQHADNQPQSLATNDITHLTQAGDADHIWICTYWQGIDRMDKQKAHFEHFNQSTIKGLPSNQTWCALDDGEGRLYVGHVYHGLSIIDLRQRSALNLQHDPQQPSSLSGNGVHRIFRDSKGRVWVGTDKGLDLLDTKTMQFRHYDDNGRLRRRIFDIREMANGDIWVATELGGIAALTTNGSQTSFRYLTTGIGPTALSGNSVRCLLEDPWQNVWIGLYGSGVDFLTYQAPPFSQINYHPLDPQHSLTSKSVMAIAEDNDHRLWIGTDGDGVNVFAEGLRLNLLMPSMNSLSVQAATTDSQGNLWLGCFNEHVYIVRKGQSTPVRLSDSLIEDTRSFYEDPQGRMWIATSNGIYVANIATLRIEAHHTFSNNLTRSIATDDKGRKWIGTFGGGLYVCSPQMQVIKTISNTSGLPSNTVNHIIRNRQGHMLVATSEGLVEFADTAHYKTFGWESGLNNIHIRAIAEDADGNVWVSTNKGISCLQKGKETFMNYDKSDNVPSANFNTACAAVSSNGETLYFGSNEGLCYFHPEKVLAKRNPPHTDYTAIRLQTAKTDSLIGLVNGQEVRFSYDENTFTVFFAVGNHALLQETEYSYYIKGLTGSWTIIEEGEVTFRNLKPGTYELQVKSRIRNHEWSEEPITLRITIRPPFWLTWWAYLLYLIAAASLAWFIHRYYRNQIHLRNLQEQWNLLAQASATKQQAKEEERKQKRQLLQASLNELDQNFLNHINQLIEARINSDIDISYLAEATNVSQSTLYRKMKSLTGITTNEYVRRYKMHYAERLLLEGRYTISEVGYKVGMSTLSYFRKCFKDEFGEAPSEYIKRIKE